MAAGFASTCELRPGAVMELNNKIRVLRGALELPYGNESIHGALSRAGSTPETQ
jgi:hypothetical protein